MREMITVEKEVYEAVLRNSVRVIDLEAENAQLRKFLEEFNALDVAQENDKLKTENKWYSEQLNEMVKEVSQLKELLEECRVYVENCEQFNQYDLDMLGKIDEVLK